MELPAPRGAAEPIVRLTSLSKTFISGGENFQALAGIDLSLELGRRPSPACCSA